MCNCNTLTQCNNCCQGVPCGCPPVYTLNVQPTPCKCCPSGYLSVDAQGGFQYPGVSGTQTINIWPGAPNLATIANKCAIIINDVRGWVATDIVNGTCVTCEDYTSTDCVTYTAQIPITCGTGQNAASTNIYGINANDTLTIILSKMCITNENVMEALLSAIGNSSRALAGFCHLVANCGSIPGTSTPIIGPITFTIP